MHTPRVGFATMTVEARTGSWENKGGRSALTTRLTPSTLPRLDYCQGKTEGLGVNSALLIVRLQIL